MWSVYDLGEMIISDKENQAGPQGTGSRNESYFVKNRKMDAPEFVSDQKYTESRFLTGWRQETGSGGRELRGGEGSMWPLTGADLNVGCNQE